jgi:alpha-glucosidase
LITFRLYDEGLAFCYTVSGGDDQTRIRVEREHSEFRFTGNHVAWAVYSAQGKYSRVTLSQIKQGCERPLTIAAGDSTYLAVGEARLVNYARMKLSPLSEYPHSLVSQLDGPVEAQLPLVTPWRTVAVASSPGELLERNYLILNLNAPCALTDTSWIKPGKVLREVTLTTTGGKACVDFAVANGLQYVEFDAGWYGHEYSEESDATTVTVDPKRSPGPLDLPDVIRYAKERGIGIILYVNRRALERQLDEVLPLFREWGVRGVKYGFVQVGSQRWTSWLHEAVRQAAEHQLMVDVHDEYRPTGYSRTYPNLMTQEGIGGDETSPSNEQTLTILFTRMLAGAGDNTICYFDGRVARNSTHAYQLAKAVCIYSPWQFLYWYDRPSSAPLRKGGAGGTANVIGDEPELEFYAAVPTVWDDTRVLAGDIGKFAIIARRRDRQWFVGCMNAGEPRRLEVPLSFLDRGKSYTAHIYRDDPRVKTRTQVAIKRQEVSSDTIMSVEMSAQGGQAIRIVPKD